MDSPESFVAGLFGTVADLLWLVFLLVVAAVCFVRGARPGLAGLRLVGAGLGVWVFTEALAWIVDALLPIGWLYDLAGPLLPEAVFGLRGISSTVWSVVAYGLGVAGVLRLVSELADARSERV
jgi:hypothetical protein